MPDLNLYWGELHNHNELGYAQGSLERSYEIARSHLDFYAFTPHGLHADGGVPDGYPVVVANWERIRRAASENNRPGEFTCFPAYEWHSSAWGHLHVLSAEDMDSMYCARSLADLQDHFRNRQTILVPHHTAYERGVDWRALTRYCRRWWKSFPSTARRSATLASIPCWGTAAVRPDINTPCNTVWLWASGLALWPAPITTTATLGVTG